MKVRQPFGSQIRKSRSKMGGFHYAENERGCCKSRWIIYWSSSSIFIPQKQKTGSVLFNYWATNWRIWITVYCIRFTLSKETVFIDGTKLEACANKYTFVWKKSVGKWEEKMFQKIQESIQLLNREYLQDFSIAPETRTQDLQKIVLALEERCRTGNNITVVVRVELFVDIHPALGFLDVDTILFLLWSSLFAITFTSVG